MNESTKLHSVHGGAAVVEADDNALMNVEDLQASLREFDQQARTFIKKNPLVAIAGAVALGFVVGRVVMK